MTFLVIATADIKRLCAIPVGDMSHNADIAALLTVEQPAWEYGIDPSVATAAVAATVAPPALDNPGLNTVLTLGVAEIIAGSYLVQVARAPSFMDDLVPVSLALGGSPPVLAVTTSEVKRLCQIASADTTQDTDIAALITAEQPAWEYTIDPEVLTAAEADVRLSALLTLGLAERMAGSYLEQKLRVPGYTDDFHVGGLDVSASKTDSLAQLAVRLAEIGRSRLEPYLWAARQAVRQKAASNAAILDTRGQYLYNRGLKRIEPFQVASRRVVTEAVKLLSGGVADGSAKVPLLSSMPTFGSVFDEGS
jgi:hypothetical protein